MQIITIDEHRNNQAGMFVGLQLNVTRFSKQEIQNKLHRIVPFILDEHPEIETDHWSYNDAQKYMHRKDFQHEKTTTYTFINVNNKTLYLFISFPHPLMDSFATSRLASMILDEPFIYENSKLMQWEPLSIIESRKIHMKTITNTKHFQPPKNMLQGEEVSVTCEFTKKYPQALVLMGINLYCKRYLNNQHNMSIACLGRNHNTWKDLNFFARIAPLQNINTLKDMKHSMSLSTRLTHDVMLPDIHGYYKQNEVSIVFLPEQPKNTSLILPLTHRADISIYIETNKQTHAHIFRWVHWRGSEFSHVVDRTFKLSLTEFLNQSML